VSSLYCNSSRDATWPFAACLYTLVRQKKEKRVLAPNGLNQCYRLESGKPSRLLNGHPQKFALQVKLQNNLCYKWSHQVSSCIPKQYPIVPREIIRSPEHHANTERHTVPIHVGPIHVGIF
jgi:hypothetical protein